MRARGGGVTFSSAGVVRAPAMGACTARVIFPRAGLFPRTQRCKHGERVCVEGFLGWGVCQHKAPRQAVAEWGLGQ